MMGDELGSVLRGILGESIEVQLSSIRRYGELRQRIASGEWDEQWVNQQFLEYMRDEGAHYRQRLTDLGAIYQRDVAELNKEFSERFYARLQQAAGGADSAGVENFGEDPPRTIRMELSGLLGTEAVGAFTLHNRRDQPAHVTFDLGDIVGEEGRLPYRMLVVEPEASVLAPGERRQILVRVALIQGLFRAGRTYSANVRVHGHERFELIITVHVRGPEERPSADGREDATAGPVAASGEVQPTSAAEPPEAPDSPEGERKAGSRRRRSPSAGSKATQGSKAAPHRPPSATAWKATARTRPVTVSRLLEEAVGRAGLDDFGDPTFQVGLARLLESAATQADLNPVGWDVLTAECRQALVNRLRITEWMHAHPELAESPVRADFIVGLPRTGTTVLSQLLSQDPGSRSLRGWEASDSVPPPTAETYQDDPRIAAYRSAPHPLYARSPSIKTMHYDAPDDPVEDTFLLAQHFAAVSVMFAVPDYNEWVSSTDLTPAYEFHHLVLQLLQSRCPGRWSLKSPGHSFGLDALYAVYPDARFVMIHRDPVTVTASMLSLASSVLAVFSDSSHARYVADYWPDALGTMIDRILKFREERDDETFFDISYEDFVGDPVGGVRRLYDFLGRELTPTAEERMRSFLARRPPGRFGRHVYRLSDFNVSLARLQERFREYRRRFSLPTAAANYS